MKAALIVVLSWLFLLAGAIVEMISIAGMFSGSHVWTGIFGIITFLNVRAASHLPLSRR